jgi:hypothetical protein
MSYVCHLRAVARTLFAALNAVDGTVIGQCLDRHRHEEFLKFMRTVVKEVPKDFAVHMKTTCRAVSHAG